MGLFESFRRTKPDNGERAKLEAAKAELRKELEAKDLAERKLELSLDNLRNLDQLREREGLKVRIEMLEMENPSSPELATMKEQYKVLSEAIELREQNKKKELGLL